MENQLKLIGCMDHTLDNTLESANRVYDADGIAPTINTCGGGGLQPKIMETRYIKVRQATASGFIDCEIGGGGRLGIPYITASQRSSNRERKDKPHDNNGEYP